MDAPDARQFSLQQVVASLADHTNDAIVITKAEPIRGNGPEIVWVNNAFSAMTGYRSDEVIGKTPRIMQRDDINAEAKQRIHAALTQWRTVREILKNYRKDGTPFWVELDIKPVSDETGWYQYWVAVQRDVTNEVRQRKQLETALEEAKAAEKAQSLFLSTMSHELRTPLNGILGMAQVLPMLGDLNDAQRRAVATMQESGAILLRLIESVLDLSRVQAGKYAPQHKTCDVFDLVSDAVSVVSANADAKGIEIFTRVPAHVRGSYLLDEHRVLQILVNLLGNAVKFTDAGRIVVRVERPEDGVLVFSVEDTGAGIPEEAHEAIFDPFYQVVSGSDRQHEGAGLGLAISRQFAEAHGGSLTVDSVLGQGSTFTLTLRAPMAGQDQAD